MLGRKICCYVMLYLNKGLNNVGILYVKSWCWEIFYENFCLILVEVVLIESINCVWGYKFV